MTQSKNRKAKSLSVIISLRQKVSHISVETRGLLHWKTNAANAEYISLLLQAPDSDLECISSA